MNFITLTGTDGKQFELNMEYIESMYDSKDGGSRLYIKSEPRGRINDIHCYDVLETRTEIKHIMDDEQRGLNKLVLLPEKGNGEFVALNANKIQAIYSIDDESSRIFLGCDPNTKMCDSIEINLPLSTVLSVLNGVIIFNNYDRELKGKD